MEKTETNRVSRQLTEAREAGDVPWEWIVDETRDVERISTWANPQGFADAVMQSYRRNKWDAQPCRVEVWSEKGTVRGTLAPILRRYEVPFRVMHGYASATAINNVAEDALADAERICHVFYVGDWDPSGLHMSEVDLPNRLQCYGADTVLIHRVALDAHDIQDPALPSFSADSKRADPRWRWYRRYYGRRAWELDALNPVVLRERVESAIALKLDRQVWDRYVTAEAVERDSITHAVRQWGALNALEAPCS